MCEKRELVFQVKNKNDNDAGTDEDRMAIFSTFQAAKEWARENVPEGEVWIVECRELKSAEFIFEE